ncbi:Arc family DNA-binding protein [Acinetobacter sp. MYb177]|uniref:Arc family DNA-binding protein n=1 Tax=unclassified Acinetobacter TaxID=196816 RepID=UPI0030955317
MARNDPQMNLRVPMELKENIEKAALDNGRTITAEAVFRLEQSFEQNFGDLGSVPTEELMKELAKRLDGFSVVANK